MWTGMRVGRMGSVVVAALTGVSCVCFLACGGGGQSESKSRSAQKSGTTASQKADMQASQKKAPAGWKTVQCQEMSLAFPGNWNGDEDAGIWWPGEGSLAMGRPALSVQCGGIPLMPNTNFEERVISHINGEPQERHTVSVAGYSGFTCTWEFMGNRHLGIFVEEKIGGGVGVIHFVDCQAPAGEFDQHEGEFEKIVGSLSK